MADQESLFTAGDRFQWFIEECYGSVYAYAEKYGFNASQVYRTINDNSSPRLETLSLYALTGLNLHWMATGKGPWWSPDKVGRELAKKMGVIVAEGGEGTAPSSIDYKGLVRTIFEIAERSVMEQLSQQQDIDLLPDSNGPGSRQNKQKRTQGRG